MAATILATGYSSVAGYSWCFVGEDRIVHVVTRADAPAREEDRWEATVYLPASRFDAGATVGNERKKKLIEVCRSVDGSAVAKQIDWGDFKSADELYWKLRGES